MEVIPELDNPFEVDKENGPLQSPKDSSPTRSLRNKKSLSILADSDPSKRNVILNQLPTKPMRQRVISESTGLVKFSLKSPAPVPSSPLSESQPKARKSGLPFYIPVDSPDRHHFSDQLNSPFLSPKRNNKHELINPEEELLFHYAKKQREVLELKNRLEQAQKELKELELQLTKKSSQDELVTEAETEQDTLIPSTFTNPVFEFKKIIQESTLGDTKSPIRELRQKVSMLNFAGATNISTEVPPLPKNLNRQKSMLQIKQDLNELSTNLITDGKKFQTDFLARSKNLFNNFQPFGMDMGNTPIEKNLNRRQSFEETFEFENKQGPEDNHELTYSTDYDSESIEDLEGGDVVPYDMSKE